MMTGKTPDSSLVVLGLIGGHHGVRGGLKVRSYTRPAEQIFEYPVWKIGRSGESDWKTIEVSAVRQTGKYLIARLNGYPDRETSESLIGCDIAIDRSRLEALEDGEFYWMDLIGLLVINRQNVELGKLTGMLETGANDVAVVTSGDNIERLLPWVPEVINKVDLEVGLLTVDWDASY